jgi:uncharacterized membrane protein YedE/YeeE
MGREGLRLVVALIAGAIFGVGLYVSQMVDPHKVLRFLDITAISEGGWDPSLALVMGAALVVMFVAVRIGARQPFPLLDRYHLPATNAIDARLIGGSALFGVGWGMSGVCPGPALAALALAPENILVFVAAMVAGSTAGGLVGFGSGPRERQVST